MPTLEQSFQDFARAQRRGNRGTSARDMLRVLGVISMIASGCFWYPVQWDLAGPTRPPEAVIALAFGTFLVLGPPVFTSFFVPWSPAAMLFAKINLRSVGQAVALACMLYLIYYASLVLFAWWSARPAVASTSMEIQQTIVGLIATIIAPALLWAPVSTEELAEILRQDNLVRKYELQVQADMAYLQSVLLDAQRAAAAGLSQIAAEQGGPEIAWRMQWLMDTIDQTIGEIAHTYERTSNTMAAFPTVQNEDVRNTLNYVASALQQTTRARAQIAPPAAWEGEQELSQEAAVSPAPARDLSPAPASAREPSQPQAAPGYHRESHILPEDPAAAKSTAYAIARTSLSGAWRRQQLERVLDVRETRAGDFIREWKAQGLVEELTEPKYHYRFTKEGATA